MTEEQVIDFLSDELCTKPKDASDYHRNYVISYAIGVIKKEIPLKPVYSEHDYAIYWDCPVCGEVVMSIINGYEIENEYNHSRCGKCGQVIDWSDYHLNEVNK